MIGTQWPDLLARSTRAGKLIISQHFLQSPRSKDLPKIKSLADSHHCCLGVVVMIYLCIRASAAAWLDSISADTSSFNCALACWAFDSVWLFGSTGANRDLSSPGRAE